MTRPGSSGRAARGASARREHDERDLARRLGLVALVAIAVVGIDESPQALEVAAIYMDRRARRLPPSDGSAPRARTRDAFMRRYALAPEQAQARELPDSHSEHTARSPLQALPARGGRCGRPGRRTRAAAARASRTGAAAAHHAAVRSGARASLACADPGTRSPSPRPARVRHAVQAKRHQR